jgi:hypothetical protein
MDDWLDVGGISGISGISGQSPQCPNFHGDLPDGIKNLGTNEHSLSSLPGLY